MMAKRKLRLPQKSARAKRRRSKDTPPRDARDVLAWLLECRHLLTPGEVAKILRLDTKKVYALNITRVQISERRTRYDPGTVHRYVVSKTTGMMVGDGFVSYCTSFGTQGGMMNAREIGRLLRVPTRDINGFDIPCASGTGRDKAWERAQVAAWLWAHGRAPSHD